MHQRYGVNSLEVESTVFDRCFFMDFVAMQESRRNNLPSNSSLNDGANFKAVHHSVLSYFVFFLRFINLAVEKYTT